MSNFQRPTPTRDSYTGHSQLITDSELRKPYEAFHPQLPDFAAAAIEFLHKRNSGNISFSSSRSQELMLFRCRPRRALKQRMGK
jgi:hypothetical protein